MCAPPLPCVMFVFPFLTTVISRQSRESISLQQSVRHYNLCCSTRKHRYIHCMASFSCDRVNIGCGRAEERFLLTGLHAVADIFCSSCKTTLGWKYVSGSRMLPSARLNTINMVGGGGRSMEEGITLWGLSCHKGSQFSK